jgi:hypothetical protein
MKRIIALILALGLICAPIAIAKDQDTSINPNGMSQGTLVTVLYNLIAAVNELTSSSAGVNKNRAILNNWNVLLLELAADIDSMKVTLTNWQTEILASTNIETLVLTPTMPAALSAGVTVNVSSITISDSTLGSGTSADPSVSL